MAAPGVGERLLLHGRRGRVCRGALCTRAAGIVFISFIVFALVLFPKSNLPEGAELPTGKQRRNRVFRACGVVMIVSVLWTASAVRTHRSILLPESLALWAFALSWLVKGYAHRTIANGVGRPFGKQLKPERGDE